MCKLLTKGCAPNSNQTCLPISIRDSGNKCHKSLALHLGLNTYIAATPHVVYNVHARV
jgi:hypothetical protein